jgi:signal transduction histidine kinase
MVSIHPANTNGEQPQRFYAITVALARALTYDQVADLIIQQGLATFQADRGLIAMVDPDKSALTIIRHTGYTAEDVAAMELAVGNADPVAAAIRSGEPLFFETRAEYERHGASPASGLQTNASAGAGVVLPLIADASVLGSLRLDWDADKSFEPDERAYLQSIANICALALERARLHDAALFELAERRRVEAMLHLLNADLEQQVAARTSQMQAAITELEAFSYSVSHDLRAPLRAMDGFSRILMEEFGSDLPVAAQHYLRRIRQNAQNMGALIDDLLAFSRLNRQALDKKPILLDDLVQQVIDGLSSEMQGRQISLQIAPLGVWPADAGLLRQVFVNLLSNAVKFTRPRDPAVIEVGGYGEGDEQVFFVRDNGVGFDMQYQSKLFGVFQRLHRAEEYEGTGVGLALVQRIIHRHGGRVWAEGALDRGATFYFTLPLEEENE